MSSGAPAARFPTEQQSIPLPAKVRAAILLMVSEQATGHIELHFSDGHIRSIKRTQVEKVLDG